MSIITDEMVVAFINGIMRTGKRANIHTDAIRAGIAAVAPLIAAEARDVARADGYADGHRDGAAEALERALQAGRKAWPNAHTYASENAEMYRAQDHAAETVLAAIHALKEAAP